MSDRHARHRRSPTDRRRRPVDGYRAASADRFDRLVDDAVSGLPEPLLRYLEDVEVAVTEVPPVSDEEVALASMRSLRGPRARRRTTATVRLTLFRRPLEARAHSRADLLELIQLVVVDHLADHFGIDDDRLDDLGWR
ncbi:MAG: metallopeptidase family protein [Actinobacteria bacterium]|jgi:predicted Zn-dependent protease with MMP-like domain|nr:metallopeptidase family protein [Actinomycetota bacterium]